ncbi:nuclear transcription factor Y subunit C-4-like [Hordeum vulgare subsp. vulgare]|uniref:Core Histone H2A/H2B/H3 domain-containing protein n=1 Tax=Hordeum vulgare subsp. vulgare TaxID=112509 RepID=A0A8I6Z6F0_HORVV|nr:nuclear transcription factor Y subunit C-4-like [Hordeum vulgare subsp. vulgare]
MGDVAGGSQVRPASAYPPGATVAAGPGITPAGSQPTPPLPAANPTHLTAQKQLMYEQSQEYQQQLQQLHHRRLQHFWAERRSEIEQATVIKNHHHMHLKRIRKIMKADEGADMMIAAEAPVLFAKACEMLTLEMTMRSWMVTEENKRRILKKSDVAAAVARTDVYDFLVDIIPMDEMEEEGAGIRRAWQLPPLGAPAGAYPPQLQVPGAAMVHGGEQVPQGHLHLPHVWIDRQVQQRKGQDDAEDHQSESG